MSVVVLKTRETVKERLKDAKESELLCVGGDEIEVQIQLGGQHDAYLCWIRSLRVDSFLVVENLHHQPYSMFSPVSGDILAVHIHRFENSSVISLTVDTI